MKALPKLLFVVSAAAALSLARPVSVFAVPIHNIVLTENSSTSLTVTYDGSTAGVSVTLLDTDTWFIVISNAQFSTGIQFAWLEPENSAFGNILSDVLNNRFTITSDFPAEGFPSGPDGTTIDNIGIDLTDGGSISATFFDKGDVAGVPEKGSTFGLLLLASTGLLGASRLRSLQLS
jgi:hypothetical protein